MTAHIIRSCIVASHAKTKQGLSGATRLNPYLWANHRPSVVGMRQKSPEVIEALFIFFKRRFVYSIVVHVRQLSAPPEFSSFFGSFTIEVISALMVSTCIFILKALPI